MNKIILIILLIIFFIWLNYRKKETIINNKKNNKHIIVQNNKLVQKKIINKYLNKYDNTVQFRGILPSLRIHDTHEIGGSNFYKYHIFLNNNLKENITNYSKYQSYRIKPYSLAFKAK